MGFFNDLFDGSDHAYPTLRSTGPVCGDQPLTPPESDSFLNKLFAPKQLAYPMRSCAVPPATSLPTGRLFVPTGTTTAPATPAAPVAVAEPVAMPPAPATPAPVTVVISMPPGASAPTATVVPASDPVATPAAPVAPVAPVAPIATPILVPSPQSRILRAYTLSPQFVPQYHTAHDELLEELADEPLARRMIAKDATPVVFVVPDGCDSIDLLYGPVEVTPGFGNDGDLDQLIAVGDAKLSANFDGIDGPLTPGDQIIVTVPWRAASWVELPAGRLRMQVLAHFYKK
jgi:hypothetical protein